MALSVALPRDAWEFSPLPICPPPHTRPAAAVTVTYDPGTLDYAITLRRPAPWPIAPSFAIQFDGPRPLTITTGRHQLSEAGRALTVTDKGFGNVLNGLAGNRMATAITGDAALTFPLQGAAPKVQAFRDCLTAPSV